MTDPYKFSMMALAIPIDMRHLILGLVTKEFPTGFRRVTQKKWVMTSYEEPSLTGATNMWRHKVRRQSVCLGSPRGGMARRLNPRWVWLNIAINVQLLRQPHLKFPCIKGKGRISSFSLISMKHPKTISELGLSVSSLRIVFSLPLHNPHGLTSFA